MTQITLQLKIFISDTFYDGESGKMRYFFKKCLLNHKRINFSVPTRIWHSMEVCKKINDRFPPTTEEKSQREWETMWPSFNDFGFRRKRYPEDKATTITIISDNIERLSVVFLPPPYAHFLLVDKTNLSKENATKQWSSQQLSTCLHWNFSTKK